MEKTPGPSRTGRRGRTLADSGVRVKPREDGPLPPLPPVGQRPVLADAV
ncbi:hypothetical protein [Amycolatopsis sp. NPDC004378]